MSDYLKFVADLALADDDLFHGFLKYLDEVGHSVDRADAVFIGRIAQSHRDALERDSEFSAGSVTRCFDLYLGALSSDSSKDS